MSTFPDHVVAEGRARAAHKIAAFAVGDRVKRSAYFIANRDERIDERGLSAVVEASFASAIGDVVAIDVDQVRVKWTETSGAWWYHEGDLEIVDRAAHKIAAPHTALEHLIERARQPLQALIGHLDLLGMDLEGILPADHASALLCAEARTNWEACKRAALQIEAEFKRALSAEKEIAS